MPKLPVFETKRLLLREPQLEDIPAYEKNFVDYEVIRFLSSSVPWPYPENGIKDFVEKIINLQGNGRWVWGIFLKGEDELIGVVDLWREGRPEHRGFWLAKKHWNQGYMTEAVAAVMDYAFDHLGFEKMIFANAVGNERSRRVKEKTGARLIDVKPAKFVDQQFSQHELWELKKEEWRKFRNL